MIKLLGKGFAPMLDVHNLLVFNARSNSEMRKKRSFRLKIYYLVLAFKPLSFNLNPRLSPSNPQARRKTSTRKYFSLKEKTKNREGSF